MTPAQPAITRTGQGMLSMPKRKLHELNNKVLRAGTAGANWIRPTLNEEISNVPQDTAIILSAGETLLESALGR